MLKLLEGKVGEHFKIGMSKDFLNGASATQEIKPAMEIKKKQLVKWHPTEWEKNFVSYPSYRGLIFRIFYKFKKNKQQEIKQPNQQTA